VNFEITKFDLNAPVAFSGRHFSMSGVTNCDEKKLLYKSSIFQSWGFPPYLTTEILERFSSTKNIAKKIFNNPGWARRMRCLEKTKK
jgi:hypothetical protein